MSAIRTDTIDEPIKVLTSFSSPKISIHYFCWRERIYPVERTTMFHISKEQEARLYHFSVVSKGNSYELVFNPIRLSWRLKAIVEL